MKGVPRIIPVVVRPIWHIQLSYLDRYFKLLAAYQNFERGEQLTIWDLVIRACSKPRIWQFEGDLYDADPLKGFVSECHSTLDPSGLLRSPS
jgi:hypothetical protein